MAVPAPVSSSFCVPYQTQLVIEYKDSICGPRLYTIKDEQGNLLFNVKGEPDGFVSRPKRRIIEDAATGKMLLFVRKDKRYFGRAPWLAFRGHTESESELLFTLKPNFSSYDVFLSESKFPDFSIEKKSMCSSKVNILYNGTRIAKVIAESFFQSISSL